MKLVIAVFTGGLGVAFFAGWALHERSHPMAVSDVSESTPAVAANAGDAGVVGIVNDLVNRRFDAVHARFGREMAAQLSPDQLRSLWATLELQIGAFLECGPIQQARHPEYTAFLVRCDFTLHSVDLKLVVDLDHKVIGLFVQPPAGTRDS